MMPEALLLVGDMREQLRQLDDNSIDSCACDPPYHLTSIVKRFGGAKAEKEKFAASNKTNAYKSLSRGFMGQTWDGGDVAFDPETWAEVLRVLKPGGHLVAFSGTRTYHRMAVAIEDAGFEIRDQLAWAYGSGFPKSLDVSKAIDKAAGVEPTDLGASPNWRESKRDREKEGRMEVRGANAGRLTVATSDDAKAWQGWGTALKPSWEPICLARKPLIGSVASNVLAHGTGALNIDGCRIGFAGDADEAESKGKNRHADFGSGPRENAVFGADNRDRGAHGNYDPPGRWPANLIHDGSDEVLAGFPDTAPSSDAPRNHSVSLGSSGSSIYGKGAAFVGAGHADNGGSAARFFYCAKAGALDRLGSTHPTVKPVELMRWLVRLVTPPGGKVLDPFAGSGSTGVAAFIEGFDSVLVELREEAASDIRRRLDFIQGKGRMAVLEMAQLDACEKKTAEAQGLDLPLFGTA
jgi:DNA modification methylase